MLAMKTMDPRMECEIICLAQAWAMMKAPVRLMSMRRFHLERL